MSDPLEFTKMTGAGNDFILLDNRQGQWGGAGLERLARGLCTPHLSLGADGLILIENSKKAHFKIRIFNSDGSESPMCGNGARCAARYAFLKVIAGRTMTIEAGATVLSAQVLSDGQVRVEVPCEAEAPRRLDVALGGRTIPGYLVGAGVPHFVVLVKDVEKIAVDRLGRALRFAPELGRGGANVDFLSLSPAPPFRLRTFERGVEAETLACGTGAVAAAWLLRCLKASPSPVHLLPRSGRELQVDIAERQGSPPSFVLQGEARVVFRGFLAPETIQEALEC